MSGVEKPSFNHTESEGYAQESGKQDAERSSHHPSIGTSVTKLSPLDVKLIDVPPPLALCCRNADLPGAQRLWVDISTRVLR